MSRCNVRENKAEKTPILRKKFFHSGHLQHESEKPDMKRKYMYSNKVKESRVSNLN